MLRDGWARSILLEDYADVSWAGTFVGPFYYVLIVVPIQPPNADLLAYERRGLGVIQVKGMVLSGSSSKIWVVCV